jgi:hypothetical protein
MIRNFCPAKSAKPQKSYLAPWRGTESKSASTPLSQARASKQAKKAGNLQQ